MTCKTVFRRRSGERLKPFQGFSTEFIVWRLVCVALALWFLFCVAKAFVHTGASRSPQSTKHFLSSIGIGWTNLHPVIH